MVCPTRATTVPFSSIGTPQVRAAFLELIVDLYLNYYYDRDEAGRKAKWTALPQEFLGDLLVCFFKEKNRNNKA